MAIGIDNNNLVGPNRKGPRNMRRTPMVLNNAFYPRLMWNSRFIALSDNPFDNSDGFLFPLPEGLSLSGKPHLLTAQAFIPPTERNEMAGFAFEGNNNDMRAEVVNRLNATPNYRKLFRATYPGMGPRDRITYDHYAAAIAEFEFSLTFANAPIDQFARGDRDTMTSAEKRGGLLFFDKAGCVSCHAVAGAANEMFSDFTPHAIAVPQIAPKETNSTFDGPTTFRTDRSNSRLLHGARIVLRPRSRVHLRHPRHFPERAAPARRRPSFHLKRSAHDLCPPPPCLPRASQSPPQPYPRCFVKRSRIRHFFSAPLEPPRPIRVLFPFVCFLRHERNQ